MKPFSAAVLSNFVLLSAVWGQNLDQIRKMEASGDVTGARSALLRITDSNPADAAALTNYAEFLERYGDPAARPAYSRLLTLLRQKGDAPAAAIVARRLAAVDLESGDRDGASRDLEAYQASSGKQVTLGAASGKEIGGRENWPTAPIPGPLRSFARMAAIPAETSPEEILPALARNIVTNGYQASHSNEELEQTEFLKLIHRYISQAKELEKVAGEKKVIEVPNCDSQNAGELLRILGFRMRGGCGSDVVLETVN